jgi:Asp-tRNA(Asn)/Glu-tRNA(Gln) amidotransferase A subunit family amidase
LRIGEPTLFFCEELDPEVAASFECALNTLDQLTAGRRKVEIPVDPDYTVHRCEAFTYHAKLVAESPHLYQLETLRRIRSGEKVTAAEYIHKRRELERQRHAAAELFREVDVIVTPTTPKLAPLIAELEKEPQELRGKEIVLLRNTRPFSILGVPAISVPCGFSRDGLPIGLQMAGRPGEDATVLALAAAYEQAAHVQYPAKI